jgi:cytochrome P450
MDTEETTAATATGGGSLFAPETLECPYPFYARLRSEQPVSEVGPGMFAVTRHEDVQRVLRDYAVFSARIGDDSPFTLFGECPVKDQIDEIMGDTSEVPVLMRNDPPAQALIRGAVNKVFTPQAVRDLEPRIQSIIEEFAGGWLARGQVELVGEFAMPLPSSVTAEALGAEPEMRQQLRHWADEAVSRAGGPQTPDRQLEVARALADMMRYFRGLIADRRKHPRSDLTSLLATAVLDDGRTLTEVEILNILETFLVGGNETTTYLIASTFHRLATDPALADRLRLDLSLAPALVEEMLRLESPAQGRPRMTTRDVELSGTLIPKGSIVMAMFGSANRDDAIFDEPDELRLNRQALRARHLAFGGGNHTCLGANLARAEARLTLEYLLPRMAALRLDDTSPIERPRTVILRGITRLPLVFEPA